MAVPAWICAQWNFDFRAIGNHPPPNKNYSGKFIFPSSNSFFVLLLKWLGLHIIFNSSFSLFYLDALCWTKDLSILVFFGTLVLRYLLVPDRNALFGVCMTLFGSYESFWACLSRLRSFLDFRYRSPLAAWADSVPGRSLFWYTTRRAIFCKTCRALKLFLLALELNKSPMSKLRVASRSYTASVHPFWPEPNEPFSAHAVCA